MLTGERAVVVLFLARILFSAPPSLILEAISLVVLAFSALAVEIAADGSSGAVAALKTRPGASSGILLGAVTLPAVMMSKLIQHSRASVIGKLELEGFEHARVLCWSSSACCFVALAFIFQSVWFHGNKFVSLSRSSWIFNSCIGIMICATVYLNHAASGYEDLKWALKVTWLLGHGAATLKLFHHILHTFPSCASIGEALLVSAGLALYSGDMLRSTIVKAGEYLVLSEVVINHRANRSEISIIIQGMVFGLLLFPLFFKFALRIGQHLLSSSYGVARASNDIWKSILFFCSLAIALTVVIPSWVRVLVFTFSEPLKRLPLCIYWIILILVSVHKFYSISKNSKLERILLRKYYHLLAVLMFVPALVFQPEFLSLAFGAALAFFLVVEIVRVWRIWPLGEFVNQFMNAFTDHRDSDILVVSHFSLLLGCALPMWMSSGFNDRPLAPFAGILSLGIGDTMASMVGYKYGVLRWSKTGKKTIEGTAAGITSVLAACSILVPLLASTGYILTQNWWSLLLAVTRQINTLTS
ncbi:Dolichol kinase EVAN-like protein [Drosera capensis]